MPDIEHMPLEELCEGLRNCHSALRFEAARRLEQQPNVGPIIEDIEHFQARAEGHVGAEPHEVRRLLNSIKDRLRTGERDDRPVPPPEPLKPPPDIIMVKEGQEGRLRRRT